VREEPSPELAEYLSMDETGLLIDLGRAEATEPELHSPEVLLQKGRAFLASLQPKVQATVCPHHEFADLPEVRLAMALASLLTASLTLGIANIVAAYVAKRGLTELCRDWQGDA
jgi:hypothetical protein